MASVSETPASSDWYLTGLPRFSKVAADSPEYQEFLRGWKLLEAGKAKSAKAVFQEGLARNSKSLLCTFGMASLNFRKDAYEESLKYVDAALSIAPGELDLLRLKGAIYAADAEAQKAIPLFTACIEAQPGDIELYRLRGSAFIEAGLLDQARNDLKSCIRIAPNSPLRYYLQGLIDLEDMHNKEAVADFTMAVGQGKNDYQSYEQRSLARTRLHDFAGARDDANMASKLSRFTAETALAEINDKQFDYDHAEKLPARRWLLACGGPLALQNDEGMLSLAGLAHTTENLESKHRGLVEAWGVHNRQELIDLIKRHEQNGHNSSWRSLRKTMGESPSEFQEGLQSITSFIFGRKGESLSVVRKYGDQFGERGILAWDLGRNVHLCRSGYLLGYLSKDEALSLMLEQGKLIQKHYTSWHQYVTEYYIGRKFWNPEIYEKGRIKNERRVRRAFLDPECPWANLPWDTPLSEATVFPERKLPLIAR